MNRGEIRTQVLDALRDGGAVRWTSDEIDRYIDDGYRKICNTTGCLLATSNLPCAASEHFITLPDDCLYPIAMRDVATGIPVDQVHWRFIDAEDYLWIQKTSTYPVYAAMWGLKKLIIHPAYAAAGSMELIYAQTPAAITSDATEPDFPVQFHSALFYYAYSRALAKDADGPRLGRALRQMRYYEEQVAGITQWMETKNEGVLQSVTGEVFRVPAHFWAR